MEPAWKKYLFTYRLPVLLILILFGALHLFIVCYNHYMFRTFTFDYGVYNYALYDYAHGRVSICPIMELWGVERTFLQDHFSLSFFLFIPFYWLLQPIFGTYTVFIIQWCFIMYGAWATYKLIALNTEKRWVAVVGLLYYFVIYGRYSSYQNDCNLATIGAAMLPVFIYYFEKKSLWGTVLSFAFIVINREDFSLCMIFMCAAFALVHRKEPVLRNRALYLSGAALLSFIIIFAWIIPALHDARNEFRLFDYTALGPTPGKALVFILTHPIDAFRYLFVNHTADPAVDGVKAKFYYVYGLSGGLLLLLRPAYLSLLIPFLAKKMYNDASDRWGCETYYSVEEASLFPALVFMTISQLKWSGLRGALYPLVCVAAIYITVSSMFSAYYPNPYLKFNFLDKNYYHENYDVKALHQALTKIPGDAPVSASTAIVPHLALRKAIYHFPVVKDAEYICLNTRIDTYPYSPQDFEREINKLLNTGLWEQMDGNADFVLLHLRK